MENQSKNARSRTEKKAFAITHSRLSIQVNAETEARTEALVMARLLAMACLPRNRTKEKQLTRILRLGINRWIKVTYATIGNDCLNCRAQGCQKCDGKGIIYSLPFGQDRLILAAVQHLAFFPLDGGIPSPIVRFKTAAEFLRVFELPPSTYNYNRLREGFKRLSDFMIRIEEASTKEELIESSTGNNLMIFRQYHLPTRNECQLSNLGQLSFSEIGIDDASYGVRLDHDFFQLLQNRMQRMVIPLNILRLYTDSPSEWDFALFLIARAGFPFCRSRSKIDHDTLMTLFCDGKENDRDVVSRLKKYLAQFHLATDHRIKASFILDGLKPKPKGQRGRRAKRWALIVEPGLPIVWSGKRTENQLS